MPPQSPTSDAGSTGGDDLNDNESTAAAVHADSSSAPESASSAQESPTEAAASSDLAVEAADGADIEDTCTELDRPAASTRRAKWSRVLSYGVLPWLALLLAIAAGFLKFSDASVRDADLARIESVHAAKDATVALLSYRADTVEQQLGAARYLLTGTFQDAYTSLTNDVVIPGAKQKQISAAASVPAVASVTATTNHAVILVFVDQTTTIGTAAPTSTASSVRVTMDKAGGRWLVSGFDPV